jgi:3-deoxy-D-manno-octulosonic-acid transferase
MALGLYTLLLRLGLPFVALRRWWQHRGESGQHPDWGEFFGRYGNRSLRSVIWLHATSPAGVRAAAPLARALRAEYPDHDVLVTSTTRAARDALRRACGNEVLSAYLPYDLPGSARRFLAHFRPQLGIVVGVEVWPVLLAACRLHGVPMVLANADLSREMARGYARFGALSRHAIGIFAACCAQDMASARRLRRLGAQRVVVTGNVEYDTPSDPAMIEEGRALMAALRGRNALLLAGTCEGEEERLLEALGQDDGTLVVIVPRHPERFEAVAALAAARGMNVARRSRAEAPHIGRRVFLGDTTGEMPFYFAMSTVAIIGGSFTPEGGRDLIEACAAGVPAVVGPRIVGFAERAHPALAVGAAIQVADAREAVRTTRKLLEIREWRERMALAGLKFSTAHHSATTRHLELCRHLLPASKRAGIALHPTMPT